MANKRNKPVLLEATTVFAKLSHLNDMVALWLFTQLSPTDIFKFFEYKIVKITSV
jgi:hypothetical protein